MRRVVALFSVLLLVPAIASGQQSSPSRFRAGIGIGSGSAGVTCDVCASSRESSLSLMGHVGVALHPDLVLGAEYTRWTKNYDGANSYVGWGTATLQWYPGAQRGFYVKGGGGISYALAVASDPQYGDQALTVSSPAVEVGTGYDFGVTDGAAITLFADYLDTTGADARYNGRSTGVNVSANLLNVGLALTIR